MHDNVTSDWDTRRGNVTVKFGFALTIATNCSLNARYIIMSTLTRSRDRAAQRGGRERRQTTNAFHH